MRGFVGVYASLKKTHRVIIVFCNDFEDTALCDASARVRLCVRSVIFAYVFRRCVVTALVTRHVITQEPAVNSMLL